jgi:hypothetical protein
MDHTIAWENDLDLSLQRASAEDKLVLLDFFNPE